MINKQRITILSILITAILLISCSEEFNEITNEDNKSLTNRKSSNKPLMEISYEMTTSTSYDVIPLNLSNLDLSSVNPSSEKQKISLELLDSGEINMTIEELDFKEKINIPHQILPDTSVKTVKTVIIGNIANFYDKKGELISTENIPMPNQMDLVDKIKKLEENFSSEDINETIATMQGYKFVDNLEEFIASAASNNIKITERSNGLITARMSLSNIDPRMTEESVLLIDRTQNKLLGTRIYSEDNELLQSVLYGYNKGKVKSLNAIQTKEIFSMPSGKETTMITLSKIENLKFNLNI